MYIARHSGAYLFVCMCVSTVFMGVGVISLWPPPSVATSTLLSSSCFLLAQMCIPEFVLGHLEQQLHGTPLIGYKASCPTRTWCAWWGAPIAGCVSACWYSLSPYGPCWGPWTLGSARPWLLFSHGNHDRKDSAVHKLRISLEHAFNPLTNRQPAFYEFVASLR